MDGDVVDDTYSTVSPSIVQNTMKISVLTKKHFGTTYVCVAKNNNETKAAKTNVTVDMRRKTDNLYFLLDEIFLILSIAVIKEVK